MTSDRHLALMALMNEIETPTADYQRHVRAASRLPSESPEWDSAVERGNRALDAIETAVRRWVTAHPEQPVEQLPDGFKRAEHVMVACAVCGYEYDEDEFIHVFKSVADAKGAAVGSGWDELKDGRVLCETGDEAHEELRRTVGVVDQDA